MARLKSRKRIYLGGSFLGWRDEVMEMLPGFDFSDPRTNRQDAIAKTVEDDMKEAEKCPISLAYHLGTMSYAELGASRANGNYIIVVGKSRRKDSLYSFIKKVASARFSRLEEAVDFIKSGQWKNSKKFPKPKKFRDYRIKPKNGLNVFVAGDARNLSHTNFLEGKVKKRIITESDLSEYDLEHLENFGIIDLTVVNFPRGARDKKAVFFMGLSYALKTPVIMIDKNPIIYPPLAGLARRIFVGDEGEKAAMDYLSQLSSQDIETEAKVMYDLFKAYRS